MSWPKFTDDCPGCRPVLMDRGTNTPLPMDSPKMQAVMAVWANTPRAERKVFHRVTCQNSRAPRDVAVMRKIVTRMQKALFPPTAGHA